MLLRTIPDVELKDSSRCSVEVYGRDGSKSPEVWLIVLPTGRRITPFESHLRGPQLTLSGMFKVIYYHSLAKLIPHSNPLLIRIPQPCLGDLYTIPVRLSNSHGFETD